jgi:hypothetical protein
MSDSTVRRRARLQWWIGKCAWWSAERPTVCGEWRFSACNGEEDSREQTIHHFVTFPAFSTNSTTTTRSKKKRGLHCRRDHSMMQGTKTDDPLWQMRRQWWKLCRWVVYGMYIKLQYKRFRYKFLLFYNSPSEPTFWINYVLIFLDVYFHTNLLTRVY